MPHAVRWLVFWHTGQKIVGSYPISHVGFSTNDSFYQELELLQAKWESWGHTSDLHPLYACISDSVTCNSNTKGWAPSGCTLPVTHHMTKASNQSIPDRSPPKSTRTGPSALHQNGGVKHATGASSKICVKDKITIDT